MHAEPRARIVLLPGAFDTEAELRAAGFAEAVRDRRLALDLVFSDVEFRDMTDRSMLERLHEGPMSEARRAGCTNLWLAGVSLGAFIAIAYAERHAREVAGLCLIAPYLGTRLASREVARAGGLANWTPTALEDEDHRLWRFLRLPREQRCDLYLGFGRDDRFSDAHRLLAAALPADRVDVVDGGHQWPAWRAVWDRFLDRFPELARPRPSESIAGSVA